MVESNERIKIKVTDDPYRIAGIVQMLLQQNNRLDEPKKYVWLCALASDMRILDIELLYEGDKEDISLKMKDVFTVPQHVGAKGIIIVVNNLSATIELSEWDQAFKKRLLEASQLMDFPLLDYIIINEDEYYSFKAAGLL